MNREKAKRETSDNSKNQFRNRDRGHGVDRVERGGVQEEVSTIWIQVKVVVVAEVVKEWIEEEEKFRQ